MANVGKELSLEVTKIIDCPYPAALSRLAELLERVDVLTIRACIRERPPCAVNKLAGLVRDALSQWPYTLRIVFHLCNSVEFRDALLLHEPCLLGTLLSKCNASRNDDEVGRLLVDLCVLLLSRPLPESISLPAHVQPFFLRVVHQATESRSIAAMKAVYSLLDGPCLHLLGLLPDESRKELDRVLWKTVSCNRDGKKSVLSAWCFGIALLAEGYDDTGHTHPQLKPAQLNKSTTWKTKPCQLLFGSDDKVNSSLAWICLAVNKIAKDEEVDISCADAIEGIRVATCALRLIDRETREAWPGKNEFNAQCLARLPARLTPHMNPRLRLQAMCFYAMVAGEGKLVPEVVTLYEQGLTDIAGLVETEGLDEMLALSLPLFSPQIHVNAVHAVMENILDACISPPGSSQLSNYVVLAEQIPSRLPNCTSLQSKISSGFSSTTLLAKIRNLINVEIKKDIGLCRAFNMSLHRKLISATVALLLTSTLTVQATGPTLPLTLTTSLIDKQRQLPHIVEECSHPLAVSGPTTVSLFEQQNTPYTGRHLQDWQEVLNSELDSQNSYQKDLIVRRIAQIIHDLETRCNTVEEPLRREKEKTQGMEQRLAEIEQHVKSLEGQITDAQDRIDGLDDELSDETKEKHKLKCELRKLQARFDESSSQAEKTLQLVQDELNDKQLELQSRVLTHQEIMRVHDEENAAYNCTIVKLREELEDVYNRHSFLSDEHNSLQHQLAEMEQELSHERDIVRNQSDDVEQLQGRSAKFEDDLHRVELELEDMTRKHDDLQVNHQKLVQSSEAAYRVLEQKYAEDMKIAATKVEEDRNRLSVQEQEALRNSEQAKEAHEKMRRELQKLKTSIPPLDAEIRELNRLCSKQERELTKFKEYHQNVINAAAAMSGFPSQHPAALQSTAQTQIDTTGLRNPRVPRESRRRKSTLPTQEVAPDPSIAAHGFTNAAMENFADASEYGSSDSLSSQGGPTPKRAKPRASSRVLSTQTPHTEKPMFASQTAFRNLPPGKRSALHPMSPNRRHTTFGVRDHDEEGPTQKLRSSKKRRASLQGNEHVHFDMDDFLAGTQLTQGDFVAGTGRIPEEEYETTTEL